jgi:hypothetical protein
MVHPSQKIAEVTTRKANCCAESIFDSAVFKLSLKPQTSQSTTTTRVCATEKRPAHFHRLVPPTVLTWAAPQKIAAVGSKSLSNPVLHKKITSYPLEADQ